MSSKVEDMLAEVDGAGAEAMVSVDQAGGVPDGGSEARHALAVFLALQFTRTTHHREQVMFPARVAKWAGQLPLSEELVAEYLESVHLGFPPRPREAEGAFLYVSKALDDGAATSEFAIEIASAMIDELVPRLLSLNWTLEMDPKRRLITSDTPVVVWRKPTRKDDFEGVGIENAGELRFPLDPGKQLVLSRRKRLRELRLETHRVRRSNVDMADGCHRFVVGRPDQSSILAGLSLGSRAPVMRFNVAPLLVQTPDGRRVREGEAMHMFVPRRLDF
ncbi:MAG: DUF4238 domain-containing protein [Chloroflexota bacterium]